jgi:hypothetical protein
LPCPNHLIAHSPSTCTNIGVKVPQAPLLNLNHAMPARDPAASPSHPIMSPNLSVGNYAQGSPSSSGYSFGGLVSPTNTTGTANVPIRDQPQSQPQHPNYGTGTVPKPASGSATGAAVGRRRLSIDRSNQSHPSNGNGNSTGGGLGLGQPDERRGSGVNPRRKPSMEWTDAP